MKKVFLTVILVLLAVAANAQFIPDGPVRRSGNHLKVNKEKLTADQVDTLLSNVNGEDLTAQWHKYQKARSTGVGLITGGSIAIGVGAVCAGVYLVGTLAGVLFVAPIAAVGGDASAQDAVDNIKRQMQPWLIAGGLAAGAGIATTTTGIVLASVNGSKMNGIVKNVNELRLAQTRNGAGLVFNF